MGKPYPRELRSRFVKLLGEGQLASAAGLRLLLPRSTATRWAKIWRDQNRCEALPMGGDNRSAKIEKHAPFILELVNEKPDIYLREIVAELTGKGVSTSIDAVRRLLDRHGVTRKKLQSPPSGT